MSTATLFSKRPRSKVATRKMELRARLWPALDPKRLWHRNERVGFVTLPRTMPIVTGIMDDMSNKRPVSAVYYDLWCHTYDDSFVVVTKPREHAFASGFRGQRAEATWVQRMRVLAELGFIDIKAGPSGPLNYVLMWNPFEVLKEHRANRTVGLREDSWNALQQRLIDIGADDLDDPIPMVEETPAPVPVRSALPEFRARTRTRLRSRASADENSSGKP